MTDRPNLLLVTTDQHRGDCVGADPACPTDADGRPLLHTPNLDHLAAGGAMFTRAYTPSPSCIPARRCLITGQTPFTNGCPGWETTPWEFDTTLAGELSRAGYQTKLTGKLHSIPNRNACGFESLDQHEALHGVPDDYARWLDEQTVDRADELSHGLGRNSWDPRPWHLDESLHPTNWTTNRALDFLDTRDPTRPFFLHLSYVRPHTPLDPPRAYWELYDDREIPDPYRGDWADDWYGEKIPEFPAADAWVADLPPAVERRARVGYYGLITHVDHQLKRVFDRLRVTDEWENTVVLFTSDHGEMLGDHHLWRKTYGFEGSARVPMFLRLPPSVEADHGRRIDRPVGLEDVMPTLLDAAGAPIPDTVEGRSLLPLLADGGGSINWREAYHGEHAPGSYHPKNGVQYLVDSSTKYVWNPVTGEELLFDLDSDPGEERNLAALDDHADERDAWRERLVARLDGRPEGFVEDGGLSTIAPAERVV